VTRDELERPREIKEAIAAIRAHLLEQAIDRLLRA
jgi:hypothetical protein